MTTQAPGVLVLRLVAAMADRDARHLRNRRVLRDIRVLLTELMVGVGSVGRLLPRTDAPRVLRARVVRVRVCQCCGAGYAVAPMRQQYKRMMNAQQMQAPANPSS